MLRAEKNDVITFFSVIVLASADTCDDVVLALQNKVLCVIPSIIESDNDELLRVLYQKLVFGLRIQSGHSDLLGDNKVCEKGQCLELPKLMDD